MWKCPKCGRTFQRQEQSHYCGKAPDTIDEYIAAQPEEARPYLNQVRDAIRAALPDAQERLSWSMPTFWKSTISSILRDSRSMWACIRDRRPSRRSQRGWRDTRPAKGPYRFPTASPFRRSSSPISPGGAMRRGIIHKMSCSIYYFVLV